jgi:hypothetical protein
MRRFPALLLAATLAAPVFAIAQQWTPPGADPEANDDKGGSVLERGLDNFMQNMLKEAEPHLDRLSRDLGDTMGALRPVLGDIGKLMDDAKNYQAPERLENGDILIRRRADAPPPPPVGDALRQMLRPAPGDDPQLNPPGLNPHLNPRKGDDPLRVPDQPPPQVERAPGPEIEL